MTMIGIWLAFLLILGFCGCRSVKYVPMETVRVEYRDREVSTVAEETSTQKETTAERSAEKIVITLTAEGDTARTDREVIYLRDHALESENSRLVAIIDSLSRQRVDSIPYAVEVPAPLTMGQRVKLGLFWWLAGFTALLVFIRIIRLKFVS